MGSKCVPPPGGKPSQAKKRSVCTGHFALLLQKDHRRLSGGQLRANPGFPKRYSANAPLGSFSRTSQKIAIKKATMLFGPLFFIRLPGFRRSRSHCKATGEQSADWPGSLSHAHKHPAKIRSFCRRYWVFRAGLSCCCPHGSKDRNSCALEKRMAFRKSAEVDTANGCASLGGPCG